jgi:hypothetical protein
MTYVIFSGEYENDVDGAASELQQAGYEVHRLPEKYRPYLAHPRDDFLEVVFTARDEDVAEEEISAIAAKFGALCDGGGPAGPEYVPFAELFKDVRGIVDLFTHVGERGA